MHICFTCKWVIDKFHWEITKNERSYNNFTVQEVAKRLALFVESLRTNLVIEAINQSKEFINYAEDVLPDNYPSVDTTSDPYLSERTRFNIKFIHNKNAKLSLESLSTTENSEQHKEANIERLENELQQAKENV
ncbi:8384_t:CDS:2 [Diversispora eburnea]|uniref:8384_t:CDS:1 n=1 Tax=Diversispora eburnea TaxID=1213867 RepID=A0A9N9CJW6_9GLOM|nr:8384_t:CDS:2 [Diversispora eburnea]